MPTPVSYSELTGVTPSNDSLREVVASFKRSSTFFLLAAFNMMLSLYEGDSEKHKHLQGFLIRNLIKDELFQPVHHAAALDSGQPRPVFHRRQMLMLMKQLLLEASDTGSNDPNEEGEGGAKYLLGDACLMLNDLLFTPEQAERLKDKGGAGERERIHDELMTQWLPQFELENPPDEGLAVARSDEYVNLFEKDHSRFRFANGQSLDERFKQLTGIGLRRYLWLLLGTYALCLELRDLTHNDLNQNMARLNFGKAQVFSKMDVTQEESRAFFERIVADLSGLVEAVERDASTSRMPQFDFTAFRSYPLVHNSDQKQNYTCIDFSFLVEKMGAGVYHTILGSLPQGDPDRSRFQIYWGEIFERYINERLRETFPPLSQRFYRSTYFDRPWAKKKEEEAFDGVLDYGDALVVLEYKGGYLSLDARYGGRAEKLLADIALKIGEGKGIKQLARGIERLFNADASARDTFSELDETHSSRVNQFRNEDARRVKKVYPVIVVQDLALALGFANRRLKLQFADKIAECNLRPDVSVRPLLLLTVEDLEVLMPHLGEITLTDVLDEYAREVHEPLSTFHGIFQAYLRRHGIEPRPNEWSKKRFEEIANAIKELFIDKS